MLQKRQHKYLKGMVILDKRSKLIRFSIIALIIVFFAYQFYVSLYASIKTESAEQFKYSEGVETVGTFIRSEMTVTSNHIGTLHYVVANGEKVAKDGIIAKVYQNDTASAAASRISEIDAQLAVIAEIEGYNDSTAVDVNTINDRITKHLNKFAYSVLDGRFSDTSSSVSELLTVMTRKQVATGEQSDFGSLKNTLEEEKAWLTKSMGTAQGSIASEKAGYFVSDADGYETVLDPNNLQQYTPEFLRELKPQKAANDVIGKIVYDYQWYLAAPVKLGDSMYYKAGQTVTVKTNTNASPRVLATVERINLSKDGDDAVLILKVTEMNSELASMRTGSITIVKDEHEGIRVKSSALRVVDGVTGVFVVSGMEAKFVTVDIIYSSEDYSICALNTSDSSKLRLYDEIIVKGKNLYDGKIIY